MTPRLPNCPILALNHSNSDLSSIDGSDSISYFSESYGKDNFPKFCKPLLELVSIVSQLSDNDDLLASEQSRIISTLQQNRESFAKATGSNSCYDPTLDSWSHVSYMNEKCIAGKLGEEFDPRANRMSAVHSDQHEIGATDSNLFLLKTREFLESSNTKFFHSA